MKIRFALSLLLLLLSLVQLSAQTDEKKRVRRFSGGVVVGFNAAQIDGDQLAGFNKAGINAGVSSSFVISERWEAGIELLFNQKGSSSTLSPNANNSDTRYSLNYADIPVMVYFRDWNFRFNAGLSYGRLLGIKIKINDIDETDARADSYRKADLGVILGATYFIDEHWGINFNWSRSIRSIKVEGTGSEVNRMLTLRGVYLF